MSLLEISEVEVTYANEVQALKSVSLTAEAGEIVALVGRSGAGKSTLLRCINGLQRPSAGRILLAGQDVTALSPSQQQRLRRKIGFIWQEFNLVERLSAFANVLTGRLGYSPEWQTLAGFFGRSQRDIALRNLERVNLLERANQRADRLSGGEKQRVAIARAISQQPTVILADEPVASLDPELAWQVMGDLARVAREDQVLTIISIHQVALAREFADRIVGIAQGQVAYDGPARGFDDEAMDRVYRFDKVAWPTHHLAQA